MLCYVCYDPGVEKYVTFISSNSIVLNLCAYKQCTIIVKTPDAHHSIGTADGREQENAVVKVDVNIKPNAAAWCVEGALK